MSAASELDGLTGAIAARFGIGYAPEGWQPLAGALANYDSPSLETAGLVIAGEGGFNIGRIRTGSGATLNNSGSCFLWQNLGLCLT